MKFTCFGELYFLIKGKRSAGTMADSLRYNKTTGSYFYQSISDTEKKYIHIVLTKRALLDLSWTPLQMKAGVSSVVFQLMSTGVLFRFRWVENQILWWSTIDEFLNIVLYVKSSLIEPKRSFICCSVKRVTQRTQNTALRDPRLLWELINYESSAVPTRWWSISKSLLQTKDHTYSGYTLLYY